MAEVGVNEELSSGNHPFAMTSIVALLLLNLMDKQFNNARYSRATVSMHG
jgi:hypothetical protein